MAFVLVALMVFFSLVFLLYGSVRFNSINQNAENLGDKEAKEIVRRLASSPELGFQGCGNCVDMDKALALKGKESYKGFWNLDYLQIQRVYPLAEGECSSGVYPDCKTITIIDGEIGTPSSAFVSLCRWEQANGGYFRCDLGRIYASHKIG